MNRFVESLQQLAFTNFAHDAIAPILQLVRNGDELVVHSLAYAIYVIRRRYHAIDVLSFDLYVHSIPRYDDVGCCVEVSDYNSFCGALLMKMIMISILMMVMIHVYDVDNADIMITLLMMVMMMVMAMFMLWLMMMKKFVALQPCGERWSRPARGSRWTARSTQ